MASEPSEKEMGMVSQGAVNSGPSDRRLEAQHSGGRREPIEYRNIDKSGWGDGPWQSEPDKRQWVDAVSGLPCLIVRGPHGGLCGYVGVPASHPAHGLNYNFWSWSEGGERVPLTPVQEAINDIEVHGGLTYADGCQHGDDPARGICHIPAAGEPDDIWWFGFDCAHAGDFSPAYDSERGRSVWGALGSPTGWGTFVAYRDQQYVEGEIARLAKQLAEMPAKVAAAQSSQTPTSQGDAEGGVLIQHGIPPKPTEGA